MTNKNHIRGSLRSVVVGSIALGIGFVNIHPSFAGCEARCKAYKARDMCGNAMNQKGLKGAERKTEFEKCKMDPYGYK
jgi:hypothetical protein